MTLPLVLKTDSEANVVTRIAMICRAIFPKVALVAASDGGAFLTALDDGVGA
jgi:hypothetical protein